MIAISTKVAETYTPFPAHLSRKHDPYRAEKLQKHEEITARGAPIGHIRKALEYSMLHALPSEKIHEWARQINRAVSSKMEAKGLHLCETGHSEEFSP